MEQTAAFPEQNLCVSNGPISDLQFRLALQGVLEKISKQQQPEPLDEADADGTELTDRHWRRDDDDSSPRITVGVLRANPVELEELEGNVKRLQAELHEAKSRNLYLSTLVEEQKWWARLREIQRSAERIFLGCVSRS